MTEDRRIVAGRFVLLDRIGAGRTGRVWRAYDQREQRFCAAKLVHQGDTTAVLRIVREQTLKLAHPHVVTPYAWCADGEDVLLAMDLSAGGTLETLINDYGALPAAYVGEILDQLLAGLSHVHAAGVVHRDVKPANVLLEATGLTVPQVRLGDFGIALGADNKRFTTTGFVVGTPGYVAPEVLEGAEPGQLQDLYAVGMVAWRLLTGAPDPQPGERPGERPAHVLDALWSLVAALCAPDPQDRPRTAADARRSLARAGLVLEAPARTAEGEPIEIFDQLGPLDWPVAESGSNRRPVLLAAAGLAVVAAVLTGLFVLDEPSPRTGSPPSTPPAASRAKPPASNVQVDGLCDWQDVDTVEKAADGRSVRCTYLPNGTYRWRPTS